MDSYRTRRNTPWATHFEERARKLESRRPSVESLPGQSREVKEVAENAERSFARSALAFLLGVMLGYWLG